MEYLAQKQTRTQFTRGASVTLNTNVMLSKYIRHLNMVESYQDVADNQYFFFKCGFYKQKRCTIGIMSN